MVNDRVCLKGTRAAKVRQRFAHSAQFACLARPVRPACSSTSDSVRSCVSGCSHGVRVAHLLLHVGRICVKVQMLLFAVQLHVCH